MPAKHCQPSLSVGRHNQKPQPAADFIHYQEMDNAHQIIPKNYHKVRFGAAMVVNMLHTIFNGPETMCSF